MMLDEGASSEALPYAALVSSDEDEAFGEWIRGWSFHKIRRGLLNREVCAMVGLWGEGLG